MPLFLGDILSKNLIVTGFALFLNLLAIKIKQESLNVYKIRLV
jgi:hypothetical protein